MGRQIKGCLSTTEELACVGSSQVLLTMGKILEENPEVHGELDLVLGFKGEEGGDSLAVQWLGLHASTAGGMGLIPGRGTKIPQTVPHGQNKIKYKIKERKGLDRYREEEKLKLGEAECLPEKQKHPRKHSGWPILRSPST